MTAARAARAAPPAPAAPATPAERAERGRQARGRTPRASFGGWAAPADRTDPLAILALQSLTRVPDLVPIRYGRMASSPFAFYRGAAAVMAADLSTRPRSGLEVQLCGDAHLSNFGGFATPERDLIFDVNDFDETIPGPFEWDLHRLAASLEVAGRGRSMTRAERRAVVLSAMGAYRRAVREFAGKRNLEVWYAHLDTAAIVARWGSEAGSRAVENLMRTSAKARSKDHLAAFKKLLVRVDGDLRFASDPPLLVPVDEAFPEVEAERFHAMIGKGLRAYRRTLSGERRRLLDSYRYVHGARKVVGVGSVGTRCWVALLVGRDEGDPLLLQIKQAEAAVIEPFVSKSRFANQGQRVVEGQRLMQAASDILLGWDRAVGPDGVTRDFYMRQLWDWKVSADVDSMLPAGFGVYAQMCGWTLALGHARSGDAIAIGAYLGSGDRMDQALADFAATYADQNERDHEQLVQAIADRQVQAESGV